MDKKQLDEVFAYQLQNTQPINLDTLQFVEGKTFYFTNTPIKLGDIIVFVGITNGDEAIVVPTNMEELYSLTDYELITLEGNVFIPLIKKL